MNILERVNKCFTRKVSYKIQYEPNTGNILFDTDILVSEIHDFNVKLFDSIMKEHNCKYKPSTYNGYFRLII